MLGSLHVLGFQMQVQGLSLNEKENSVFFQFKPFLSLTQNVKDRILTIFGKFNLSFIDIQIASYCVMHSEFLQKTNGTD